MNTKKEGVVTIHTQEGKLHGMIYRDPQTGHKVLYRCEPMDEDEIIEIIENRVEGKVR